VAWMRQAGAPAAEQARLERLVERVSPSLPAP
jgi:hypothetical protein